MTELSLEGGAEIDLTPLSSLTTLEEVSFCGSAAVRLLNDCRTPVCGLQCDSVRKALKEWTQVANIAPLAKIVALRLLDLTACERVTDRRAFAASVELKIVPA